MAEVEGFRFEESLTGFKWIGNTAMRLEKQRLNVIFSYEEAIGFTIGDIVKDKDGVSALAFFSEWAVQLYKRGITAYDYLEELYKKYGYFVSENSYFICDDKKKISKIFDRIRFGEEKQREDEKVRGAIHQAMPHTQYVCISLGWTQVVLSRNYWRPQSHWHS